MNLPTIKPIIWNHAGRITPKPEPIAPTECIHQQPQQPLKPAKGKLAELENAFIQRAQQKGSGQIDSIKIIKLLDKYKRVTPDSNELNQLAFLILN